MGTNKAAKGGGGEAETEEDGRKPLPVYVKESSLNTTGTLRAGPAP